MNGIKNNIVKYYAWIVVAIITIVAFVIRIRSCFWGYPLQLHVDEPVVVDSAINMLWRHSWNPSVFYRPDHFEIKCDAIIFTIFSWLKFHQPAYDAFKANKADFYVVARIFTTLFGTALIPLACAYTKKLLKTVNENISNIAIIVVALFTAFGPHLIQNSAYATPDLVLTFFMVLFAYFLDIYLEKGTSKYIYICAVIIGVGITIKYPAAILCLPLAVTVIYKTIVSKQKIYTIINKGFISICTVLATMFAISYNLFTDFDLVYDSFVDESTPVHLGHDGLGAMGNLTYYIQVLLENFGYITALLFIIGFVYALVKLREKCLTLFVGVIYLLCISVLSLHWIRWEIPVFPFYIIFVSFGLVATLEIIRKLFLEKSKLAMILSFVAVFLIMSVISLNIIVSGLCIVKTLSLKNVKASALEYILSEGITEYNGVFEDYTNFDNSDDYKESYVTDVFSLDKDGNATLTLAYANKEYLILGNSRRCRILGLPDDYPYECSIYNGIENTYELVFHAGADDEYGFSKNIFSNISIGLEFLSRPVDYTGGDIFIYKLTPEFTTLQDDNGLYYRPQAEEIGTVIELSQEEYQWAVHRYEDGRVSYVSPYCGYVLHEFRETPESTPILTLWYATEEEEQIFEAGSSL